MASTFKPATKIVSRKQWRYLRTVYDGLVANGTEAANWTEYTQTHLREFFEAVDYDALPERSGDPEAPKRDQHGLCRQICACGCGEEFTSKGRGHKYVNPSHRPSKTKKAPVGKSVETVARRWIPGLAMWITVDPAVDHYETRRLA